MTAVFVAPLAIALPLLVAAVLAGAGSLLPKRAPTYVALATSVVVAVLCAWLVRESRAAPVIAWMGGWRPRAGMAPGIALVVDPIGAGLGAMSAALTAAALAFTIGRFDEIHALFDALMLIFLAALVAFGLTGDLFDLFVFFELMSAAAYALCGYRSDEPRPLQGALNFAVTNTVGASLVLIGIILVYGRTGALNLASIQQALGTRRDALVVASFWLMACGFFVKAAVFPFHFWLDDAHAVAPSPVSVIFSGVMVTAGLFGVSRVWWTVYAVALSPAHGAAQAILMTLGAATALMGAAMCWAQRHLKRLLAFSTIGHVGVMLLGVGTLSTTGLSGACLYALGHGFVKGALFLLAGAVLHSQGSLDEICLHGRGPERAALPWFVAAIALAGIPPFGTFLGDESIIHAARDLGAGWVGAVTASVGVLTGGATLRVGARVFLGWGPRRPEVRGALAEQSERRETQGPRQTTWSMVASAVALVALSFGVGVVPGMGQAVLEESARFRDSGGYAAAVMRGAVHVQWATAPPPVVPHLLRPLLVAAGACLLATLALFRSRIPRLKQRPVRLVVNRLFGVLRRIHSGHVGDYVTWVVLGAAAISLAGELAMRCR